MIPLFNPSESIYLELVKNLAFPSDSLFLRIYSMYVKNNLGPSSSNGLSADVPCSKDTSVESQAKSFPVKGLNGGCQKDLGNEKRRKPSKSHEKLGGI
jgi:hypothetical protein